MLRRALAQEFEVEMWLPRSRGATERLDLVVFVLIEEPDRLLFTDTNDKGLRHRVDDELREIVVGGRWGFETETLEVSSMWRFWTPWARTRGKQLN